MPQGRSLPAPTRPPFKLSLGAARGSSGQACRPNASKTRAENITCTGQPAGRPVLTRLGSQPEAEAARAPPVAATAAAVASSGVQAAAQTSQGRHPMRIETALGKRKTVWAEEKPATTVGQAASAMAVQAEVAGEDSDSDFVAGTLRQAALPAAANTGIQMLNYTAALYETGAAVKLVLNILASIL